MKIPVLDNTVLAPTIEEYGVGDANLVNQIKTSQKASQSPTELYKRHLYALSLKYGLDYKLLESIIHCESSWNSEAIGDSGLAFGLAQFHKLTFDGHCIGEYKNPFDQLNCFAKMMSEGKEKHWTCFRYLTRIEY